MIEKPEVETVEREDHAVVYPHGYLNGSKGEQIDLACADLMRKGVNRIIINFDYAETINTTGVASLLSLLERVGRRKGVLCFCNLMSANRQMLDVLDVSRAVLIFDDEEEARRHLTERHASAD
jgi:anti-anti-sigma factor